MASSGAWPCTQQGCWPSRNSKQIFKIFHLARFLGTKTVRMSNACHTYPCTFPLALWKTTMPNKKKIAILPSITHFKEEIFTRLCICRIGWVPADCKHSSASYLHSTAPTQRTPRGWCKDRCAVWSLSSGRKRASSSSCCQRHRVTLAPSFMLCLISPCARAVTVVSCQWPVPKVPFPFSTWSYLALPSCHQDILSGCSAWTNIT